MALTDAGPSALPAASASRDQPPPPAPPGHRNPPCTPPPVLSPSHALSSSDSLFYGFHHVGQSGSMLQEQLYDEPQEHPPRPHGAAPEHEHAPEARPDDDHDVRRQSTGFPLTPSSSGMPLSTYAPPPLHAPSDVGQHARQTHSPHKGSSGGSFFSFFPSMASGSQGTLVSPHSVAQLGTTRSHTPSSSFSRLIPSPSNRTFISPAIEWGRHSSLHIQSPLAITPQTTLPLDPPLSTEMEMSQHAPLSPSAPPSAPPPYLGADPEGGPEQPAVRLYRPQNKRSCLIYSAFALAAICLIVMAVTLGVCLSGSCH